MCILDISECALVPFAAMVGTPALAANPLRLSSKIIKIVLICGIVPLSS